MQALFLEKPFVSFPAPVALVGLLLDLIGTALLGKGVGYGVLWYQFIFYFFVQVVIISSVVRKTGKEFKDLNTALLAIGLALLPADIHQGVVIIDAFNDVPTQFASKQTNDYSAGGGLRVAGLIIVAIAMFVQLIAVTSSVWESVQTAATKSAPKEGAAPTVVAVEQ